MAEARVSIRIDADTKARAEQVLRSLGLTLSSGIHIFLSKVAIEQAIPFSLSLDRRAIMGEDAYSFEQAAANIVREQVSHTLYSGKPVARFDREKNRPYLEYQDGRREYELED
ncbi:MAG: type II toxin-antitoxin system RelB/DinJ family antitoxin [Clostridiales Family XIII bacterium]|nr:type II toxin-antitoxin system RelB/DinJ family antitoxin [Clostridiales Family XIII bacterium]